MIKFFRNLLIISALLGIFATPVIITSSASAVDIFSNCTNGGLADKASCSDCEGLAQKTDACKDIKAQQSSSSNPILTIIKAAIDLVSKIVGFAAIISVIASGIRLVIANGDSNAISSARNGLLYSLIGIAVTVLAQVIVVFVLKDVN